LLLRTGRQGSAISGRVAAGPPQSTTLDRMSIEDLAVVCADVGSVARGNFGWWSSAGESGSLPSSLASHVAALLNARSPVALGFECPLFVPLLEDEACLTNARPGEGSRPWSAGAGSGALATGLVQVAWVLQAVRARLERPESAFLAWPPFVAAGAGIFLWEAFVSGAHKRASHVADAQVGASAFIEALPDPRSSNAVVCQSPVHSLAGAALLRCGWSCTLAVLAEPCLVLRAGKNAV
jgi:hypothetical protein